MNVILIAAVNLAICVSFLITLFVRATNEGIVEDFGSGIFVTGAFTVFGFILLFSFPYKYITVCEYRWYFFVIAFVLCMIPALITYRVVYEKKEEDSDPLCAAAFAALITALFIQTLFYIFLANGIFTYKIPSGEQRVFMNSFFESREVAETLLKDSLGD